MAEMGLPFVIRGAQVEATYLDLWDDEELLQKVRQRVALFAEAWSPGQPVRAGSCFSDSGGQGTAWLVVFQYLPWECAFEITPMAVPGAPIVPGPSERGLVPNPLLRSWTLIDVPSGSCLGLSKSPSYIEPGQVASY